MRTVRGDAVPSGSCNDSPHRPGVCGLVKNERDRWISRFFRTTIRGFGGHRKTTERNRRRLRRVVLAVGRDSGEEKRERSRFMKDAL